MEQAKPFYSLKKKNSFIIYFLVLKKLYFFSKIENLGSA